MSINNPTNHVIAPSGRRYYACPDALTVFVMEPGEGPEHAADLNACGDPCETATDLIGFIAELAEVGAYPAELVAPLQAGIAPVV
jgi:hypothetical protein